MGPVTAHLDQPALDLATALDRARRLAARPARSILGITGPPGCGKSTLAAAISSELGQDCVLVPMDGFHLADVALEELGLRGRKGAPETFDSWGYAALLGRLRADAGPVVYAPAFERGLEQPIAGSIAMPAGTALVITEGNYLLHDGAAWAAARECLDEIWYCDVDDETRLRRLTARHVQFGKTRAAAAAWVAAVDEPNARLIAATRQAAHALVTLE
ncbi:MAG: nucleoside/nucleotide kinase family protein [Actinomycetota bacterium]